MILKRFQQTVIDDLERFLSLLNEGKSNSKAFHSFWDEKKSGVGELMSGYNDVIKGVPSVCLKIPTGGGKTFVACSSIKPIFDNMPTPMKAVVWLVPSDTILEQTKKNLKNSLHEYRQRLNVDFANKVTVYEKSELLAGTNFNPTVVSEQLSVFVLSYDSFRTGNKEGRKAYQQNGNLMSFAPFIPKEVLLEGTEDDALIQVIRWLNPVIIIDESHHATSKLSREMLENFNPSFILELTATPKNESNIISYVDAHALKEEEMIKLPVIVYNKQSTQEVITQAIDTRNKLEEAAKGEKKYVRPIVLFQAEPKTTENSETFTKIKNKLIALDIPKEQIAIQTSTVKELRGVDLMSEDCPIRYIITVNALKEGWDCPFAYVLATIANRSSQVDVEQILGRVLRLPHAKLKQSQFLNLSYVYTSSNAFQSTLERVVAGLKRAGFEAKDYQAHDETENEMPDILHPPTIQSTLEEIIATQDEEIERELDFDEEVAKQNIEMLKTDKTSPDLEIAAKQSEEYDRSNADEEAEETVLPPEVRSKMKEFKMNDSFKDEAEKLLIPQFVIATDEISLINENTKLLRTEDFNSSFTLTNKDTNIEFININAEISEIDIDGDSVLKTQSVKLWGNTAQREFFKTQTSELKIQKCKEYIISQLTKDNGLYHAGLAEYVERIVKGLSSEQLEDLQENTYTYLHRVKRKISDLRKEHCKTEFYKLIEKNKITCEPMYAFPKSISPARSTERFAKMLYTAEEEMNNFEKEVVWELEKLNNIKWWHRNPVNRAKNNRSFSINGFVNAFPDIVAMTHSGMILVIEPKGDFLDGENSQTKVEIGCEWQELAGRKKYRYYMVFPNKDLDFKRAYRLEEFLEAVKGL